MSKLLCLWCTKTITLPDDFTGREVTCPLCNNTFPAPSRYTPTVLADPVAHSQPTSPPQEDALSATPSTPVAPSSKHTEPSAMLSPNPSDRPSPPPGLVPATPPVNSAPALAAGYTGSHAIVISPGVIKWLPPILLTFTLVCTFFPWVGTYIGSAPVDSYGPWRALVGKPSRNYRLEDVMQVPSGMVDNMNSDWGLMLPCLLALILAVILAWVDRATHRFDPRKVIPPLERYWQWRHALIAILAAFAFFLLLFQVNHGFGLERAIRTAINEQFAPEREQKNADLDKIAYREKEAFDRFNLEHSTWLYLGLLSNFLALFAILAQMGLEKRGSKPPPRIVFEY